MQQLSTVDVQPHTGQLTEKVEEIDGFYFVEKTNDSDHLTSPFTTHDIGADAYHRVPSSNSDEDSKFKNSCDEKAADAIANDAGNIVHAVMDRKDDESVVERVSSKQEPLPLISELQQLRENQSEILGKLSAITEALRLQEVAHNGRLAKVQGESLKLILETLRSMGLAQAESLQKLRVMRDWQQKQLESNAELSAQIADLKSGMEGLKAQLKASITANRSNVSDSAEQSESEPVSSSAARMRGKWADRFTQLTPRLLNIIPRPESMHDDEGAQIRTTSERQMPGLNDRQRAQRYSESGEAGSDSSEQVSELADFVGGREPMPEAYTRESLDNFQGVGAFNWPEHDDRGSLYEVD